MRIKFLELPRYNSGEHIQHLSLLIGALTSDRYATPVDWAEENFAKPMGLPGQHDEQKACDTLWILKVEITVLSFPTRTLCTRRTGWTNLHWWWTTYELSTARADWATLSALDDDLG